MQRGHVEHLTFKALDDQGEPTKIFKWLKAWNLADYPIADEQDYCEREHEATLENITNSGHNIVADDAPEDWAAQMFTWFWHNDQGAVENCDDNGGYPSDEQMRTAAKALGFAEEEEE